MKRQLEFSDIEVVGSWRSMVRVEWQDRDWRYHAYFRMDDGQPDTSEKIIRMARKGAPRHQWSEHRKLDPTSKKWRHILGALARVLDQNNMIQAARDEVTYREAQRKAQANRAAQIDKLHRNAWRLLQCLRAMNQSFVGDAATDEQRAEALLATTEVLAELQDVHF